MGSEIALWLDAAPEKARRAFRQAESLFQDVEAALSRFRPDSELMRLNASAQRFVPVSSLLWEVASGALRLAKATGGLFDPTIQPALVAAGYDRDFALLDGGKPHHEFLAPVTHHRALWRQVRLDRPSRALWLPAGAALDLGGIAKGYTARLAVDLLAEVGPCLVDAGGDLAAGSAPDGLPGWPVAIAAPGPGEGGDLLQLWLAEGTLATSGIDFRRWQREGRLAHHLIDPRSGLPAATDLLTVSVLARDAMEAEGWATAALVAGRTAGYSLLAAQKLPALLAAEDGSVLMTPAMTLIVSATIF